MSDEIVRNRDGHVVKLLTITKVEETEQSYGITSTDGMTFGVSKIECDGFVPQVDDPLVLTTQNFSMVAGVIINGRVIRNKSQAMLDAEHETWMMKHRLDKLERYIEEGDALKARVEKLHPRLRARMYRFAAENGRDFWIDDAPYEMYALEGANALLDKVKELELKGDAAVEWINDWWDINSDKHDPPYDYKKQMEMVPDFGDGHSGNTAAAAKAIAILVLEGRDV